MLEELEIHNLGPIRSALIAPAGGMTAITGETGAGKSMLLSAIRLISGGPSDGGRVSVGAQEAWAQGVFEVASSPAAVAAAREAGFEPEDGELFLSRKVPASGRSRSMLSGRSVPRSVLASVAAELVTIHGQADQLRIATTSRQREFLDRYAGDEVALAAYGKSWSALRAMDERLERLNSQESSMRQQADYLRESIERINRVDPQPGEMDELRARRDRIENAAEIAEGVTRALGALDASQVVDDVESSSAADLIDHASQALRAIHVEGVFSELADRLDSISTDLSDVVFSLSGEVDNEASMEDLDAINGRIHELDELSRRWGPELSDVIAWRDKAVYDLEDLDASPEKVEQLEAKRAQLLNAAKKAAQAVAIRQQEKYQDGLSEYIRHVNHAVSETEADAMAESFIEYARQYDVDEKIVMAVAQTESAYCADAVSCADFKGLMQTGDYLAESAGHTPSELFDPEISIKVGASYIRDKIEEFGDIRLALTAYNQGSGSVHSGNYSTGYAELTMERAQALEEFLRGRGYPEENSFLRNGDIS